MQWQFGKVVDHFKKIDVQSNSKQQFIELFNNLTIEKKVARQFHDASLTFTNIHNTFNSTCCKSYTHFVCNPILYRMEINILSCNFQLKKKTNLFVFFQVVSSLEQIFTNRATTKAQ